MGEPGIINEIYQLLFNVDQFLYGFKNVYLALVVVCILVFCETGLVVAPFLPGDSLLFVFGTLVAVRMPEAVVFVCICIALSAILGNTVNYAVGRKAGRWILIRHSKWVSARHLHKTEEFYEKYGSKTLVIARFVPFVRTIAPFMAGVASMKMAVFNIYNMIGAALWVILFVFAGYYLGTVSIVRDNLALIMISIIAVSMAPGIWALARSLIRKVWSADAA